MRGSLIVILLFLQLGSVSAQGGKRVKILNADEWIFDPSISENAQRLIGNVRFQHKDVLMDCDSAYMYGDNKVRAFSRVLFF